MSFHEITLVTSIALGLLALAFWLWMLVDCLRHEGPAPIDRAVWVVVIILLKVLGAGVYYFMRYRTRQPHARA